MQQLWVRWPLQPLQPHQKAKLQPPVGPSVDLLCHPCITTAPIVSYLWNFRHRLVRCYWYLCGATGIIECDWHSGLHAHLDQKFATNRRNRPTLNIHCMAVDDWFFFPVKTPVSDTPSCLGTSLWSNCTRLIHRPASLLNVLSTSGDDLRRRAVEKKHSCFSHWWFPSAVSLREGNLLASSFGIASGLWARASGAETRLRMAPYPLRHII